MLGAEDHNAQTCMYDKICKNNDDDDDDDNNNNTIIIYLLINMKLVLRNNLKL